MIKWIMLILLVFISSMFGRNVFGESGISSETAAIINKIAKEGTLIIKQSEPIDTKLDNNFTVLKSIAKKEELVELTNHQNKIVRCYAFWALSHYDSVDLFPIILNHIDDKENISLQLYNLIEYGWMVGDFFIEVATSKKYFLESNKLTPEQITKLDYLLITTPNELSSKNAALMRVEPIPALYSRIRDLYIKDNNQSALVTLAKYRKEQDIELILNNREKLDYDYIPLYARDPQLICEYEEQGFNYTYIAISYFPHAKFFPLLEKNLLMTLDNFYWSDEWRNLHKAIASYKNNNALILLQIPLTQVIVNESIRKTHLESIRDALLMIKDPIYVEPFWKLWIEEDIINLEGFNYLLSGYPKKTLEVTKNWLENPGKPWDSWEFKNLITEMLDIIFIKEKNYAIEIIKKNIKETTTSLFEVFADKITEVEDKSDFIEPLFIRLSNESKPHIYLRIVKILIAYNDDKINKRILDVRGKNTNLQSDWGGDALNNLLINEGIIR